MIVVYSDGGSKNNPGPAAIAVLLCDEKDNVLEKHSDFMGKITNNQAEYRALIKGLELASKRGKEVECVSDSELMINQLNGKFKVKDKKLKDLFFKVKKRENMFTKVTYSQVPREHKMIQKVHSMVSKELRRY